MTKITSNNKNIYVTVFTVYYYVQINLSYIIIFVFSTTCRTYRWC